MKQSLAIKRILILLGLYFLVALASAQKYNLEGCVVDRNSEALVGATVILSPKVHGTVTNENGHFYIKNIDKGTYAISISYMGYHTYVDSLVIDKDAHYDAYLKSVALSLQEVVVEDHYAEQRKQEESLNIEIVSEAYLKQNLGASLMNSLERLPGVTTIDIGSGQSKPVIRGLGFNRVVVVENNIKHEAQQWGADHGLEIDQYAIDNIEVIKGPASLMYGSDAIGGVIDMKNTKLPVENSFGGSVDLSGKTNNDFLGTSIALYGRKKSFFATARATLIDYGDYKVPTETVSIYSYPVVLYDNHMRNTAGEEQNFHLSLGWLKDEFRSRFYFSSVNSESGFFANAHGLEPRNVDAELHDESSRDIQYPYQTVNHIKLTNTSSYHTDKMKLELDLGVQRNFREELNNYTPHGYMSPIFPDTLPFSSDLERQFDKQVYSGSIKGYYDLAERAEIRFGLNSEYQHNAISGSGFLIPAYRQMTAGAFAFGKYHFSDESILQMGLRYDYGMINTQKYIDWYTSPVMASNGDTSWVYLQRAGDIEREFSNVSWSIGYSYNPGHWSYKVNAGKSFRMPIAKELAANGVEWHMYRYVKGDATLNPEESWQLDAGLEYHSKRFAIGISPFANYFSNYIYLNPTSEHSASEGAGLLKYYYQQSKVFRYGSELHAHYELLESVQLGFIGEYVYSMQLSGEKKYYTLPFSPPPSAIINIKYHREQIKFLKDVYASLDYRLTAAQHNIVPPEEPTDGYQLFNLSFGGSFTYKGQRINMAMQVQNLFNTKYFNHTSFYRLINAPEPGRNFVLNISIPFSKQ